MNILITTHTYLPNIDGVEAVNKYLFEGLVKRGHSVDILTYRSNKLIPREETISGVRIFRFDVKTNYTFHKGEKKEYLKWIIDNYSNYDVMVNICTQTALTDWVLPIINKIAIPKILYLHSIWDFKLYDFDKTSVSGYLKKIFANLRWYLYYKEWATAFKSYERVIQLHKKDRATEFFKKKYNIHSYIIENAADDDFFTSTIDEELDIPSKYILNVASYMDKKNQMDILKSFIEIRSNSDFELIFIGNKNNRYYEDLKEKYQEYKENGGDKKVHLLYGIDRKKIYSYVKKANLFVSASKQEAFPISIIEAMAAGVPFISTDVGIVKELPGGCVISKIDDLKQCMEMLMNDEVKRVDMGKCGKEYAINHLTIEAKVSKLEEIIKGVLCDEKK